MPTLDILTGDFSVSSLGNDVYIRRGSYAPCVTPKSPDSSQLLRRAKWAPRISVPEVTALPAGRVDSSLFHMILQRGRDRGGSYPVIDGLYPTGSPQRMAHNVDLLNGPLDPCPSTFSPRIEKVEPLSPTATGKCRITVAVRVRTFARAEVSSACTSFLTVDGTKVTVRDPSMKSKSQPPHHFSFDEVLCCPSYFPGASAALPASQQVVFETLGVPLLKNFIRGYNACLLCYGQTGSGKTYTMMGTPSDPGVVPRYAEAAFQLLEDQQKTNGISTYSVQVSYIEIYNEKVHDLLAGTSPRTSQKSLRVRQHPVRGPFVEGLTQHAVTSGAAILSLLRQGNDRRATAATRMNDRSSRSHAIVTLELAQQAVISQPNAEDLFSSKTSYMRLVDLAGSERVAKSNVNSGARFQELTAINLSLTTLSRVIEALSDPSSTVRPPYRESLLTWLLADSFGGNSKTTMIATVSPALSNASETLSTLRYASRARKIVNKAVINEDPSTALISSLQVETQLLRAQLAQMAEKNSLLLESRPSLEEVAQLHHKLCFSEKLIEELRQHEEIQRQAWELRFQRLQCQASGTLEAQRSCRAMQQQLETAQLELWHKTEEVAALHQTLAEREVEVAASVGRQQHVQNESGARDAEGRQPELSLQTLRSDRDQLAHQNAELRAALEREVALREAAVQERQRWEEQAKVAEGRLLEEPQHCKHTTSTQTPRGDGHGAIGEAAQMVTGEDLTYVCAKQHAVSATPEHMLQEMGTQMDLLPDTVEFACAPPTTPCLPIDVFGAPLFLAEGFNTLQVPGQLVSLATKDSTSEERATTGSDHYVQALVEEYTKVLCSAVENRKEWRDLCDNLTRVVEAVSGRPRFAWLACGPKGGTELFEQALHRQEELSARTMAWLAGVQAQREALKQNVAVQLSINQQLARERKCFERERDSLQVQLDEVSGKFQRALEVVRRLHNERD